MAQNIIYALEKELKSLTMLRTKLLFNFVRLFSFVFAFLWLNWFFGLSFSGLLCWLSGKELPANAGDADLIPVLGRSPGGGNGNPLQYSCLENSRTEEPGGLWSKGSQKSHTKELGTKQQKFFHGLKGRWRTWGTRTIGSYSISAWLL